MFLKSLYLISIILTLTSTLPVKASSNLPAEQTPDTVVISKSDFQNVTIIAPAGQIYDDGVYRKSYSGYRIFDLDNKELIRVASSIIKPVSLKMAEGVYIVKTDVNDSVAYQITVSKCSTHEFVIP